MSIPVSSTLGFNVKMRVQAPRPSLGHWTALAGVPIAWGSFTPALKLLQLEQAAPPPAALLNLGIHSVGAL